MTTFNTQPSIAWEDVEKALVDWVLGITSLQAIWAEDGGPQPNRPYVELDWLVPPSLVGEDYWSDEVDTDEKELARTIEGVRAATVTVQVHANSRKPGLTGQNAMYFADVLSNSLSSDTVTRTYFDPVRMAVWDIEALRKGAWTEDKKPLSRTAFDVRFGFSAGTTASSERIGYITQVSLTGVVSTPEDELTQALSITS